MRAWQGSGKSVGAGNLWTGSEAQKGPGCAGNREADSEARSLRAQVTAWPERASRASGQEGQVQRGRGRERVRGLEEGSGGRVVSGVEGGIVSEC